MCTEEVNKRLTQKITLLEEELDAMRDRMQKLQSSILSNISHDIRTPMNAIVGFANLLTDKNMGMEERIDCIDNINSHSAELLEIIDNMIDASLLQHGGIKLFEDECYLNDLLAEIYESASGKTAPKNLALEVYGGENDDFFIIADYKRLRQIFHNLIDNAVKFTSTGSIEIGYNRSGNHMVTFYVRDTGIGLASSNHEDIFKPFRTESNGSIKGAGLGLSVSRSLVELMGGEMWPESCSGKGTCIYFSLPVRKQSFLKNRFKQISDITKRNIASFL